MDTNEPTSPDADAPKSDAKKMRYYAVGTLSGYELKAQQLLAKKIQEEHLAEKFGEILVPTEEVVELAGGKKRKTKRKVMPGYMFVQMVLDEQTWNAVRHCEKVIGFIGDDKNPKPMSEKEVSRLRQDNEEGAARPKAKQTFEEGVNVRVIDGPFLNFSGVVEEVMPQKQKVRVLVSIFGRATPVELDFMQVERI